MMITNRVASAALAAASAALVAALGAGGLAAQVPSESPVYLRGREVQLRDELHPDLRQALVVVGLEQGGNEFRSRTPALALGDRRRNFYDEEAMRNRRLALYRGEVQDSAAPPVPKNAPAPQVEPAPVKPAEPLVGSRWLWVLMVVGAVGGLFWMRRSK